jgi:hypothetical protein
MKTMTRISIIVFFGSLWGILEATLGYALQFPLIPFFVSGMIMFPIAAGLLIRAYLLLQSRLNLLWIGIIAMSIKSINLLLPMNPWRTVNPMIAIILESLLMVGVVTLIVKKPIKLQVVGLFAASIGWRTLFLAFMFLQYTTTGFLHNDISSLTAILTFIFIFGVVNTFIALLIHQLLLRIETKRYFKIQFNPIMSATLFVIALVLSYIL